VRAGTRIVATIVATSSALVAWSIGQQSTPPDLLLVQASPAVTDSSAPAPTATQDPAQDTGQDTGATSTAPAAPADSNTGNTSATPTTTPAPTATQAPTAPAPVAPVVVSVTSDAITYKYGTVQVALTVTDGAITSVKMVQGDASNGRADAYTSLVDATLAAQSTNYGNISGATFTVDAFKKAVDNALAKI